MTKVKIKDLEHEILQLNITKIPSNCNNKDDKS